MLHTEELLDIGAVGFMGTTSMVKNGGQHELHALSVIAEYEDVFVAFGMANTRHMRRSCDRGGARSSTSFTSSIPISASRDGRAERAY